MKRKSLRTLLLSALLPVTACATGADLDGDPFGNGGGPTPIGSLDAGVDEGLRPDVGAESGAFLLDSAPSVDSSSHDAATVDASDSAVVDSSVADTSIDVSESTDASKGSDSSAPTTCAEADEKAGCCVGDVVYYCETTTLTTKACTGGKVCGWDTSGKYYDCVAAPGGADPSGTYPLACK